MGTDAPVQTPFTDLYHTTVCATVDAAARVIPYHGCATVDAIERVVPYHGVCNRRRSRTRHTIPWVCYRGRNLWLCLAPALFLYFSIWLARVGVGE